MSRKLSFPLIHCMFAIYSVQLISNINIPSNTPYADSSQVRSYRANRLQIYAIHIIFQLKFLFPKFNQALKRIVLLNPLCLCSIYQTASLGGGASQLFPFRIFFLALVLPWSSAGFTQIVGEIVAASVMPSKVGFQVRDLNFV